MVIKVLQNSDFYLKAKILSLAIKNISEKNLLSVLEEKTDNHCLQVIL